MGKGDILLVQSDVGKFYKYTNFPLPLSKPYI